MEILTKEKLLSGQELLPLQLQDLHSLSKENQASLVRTFLSEPGPESKISRLGGWVWKMSKASGVWTL